MLAYDVDTVVIGSGMSGLSCAAVLSRMGQRVLVLEQRQLDRGVERVRTGEHRGRLGRARQPRRQPDAAEDQPGDAAIAPDDDDATDGAENDAEDTTS